LQQRCQQRFIAPIALTVIPTQNCPDAHVEFQRLDCAVLSIRDLIIRDFDAQTDKKIYTIKLCLP
jgi:hypothetical protein